jgi:hypothetical protein
MLTWDNRVDMRHGTSSMGHQGGKRLDIGEVGKGDEMKKWGKEEGRGGGEEEERRKRGRGKSQSDEAHTHHGRGQAMAQAHMRGHHEIGPPAIRQRCGGIQLVQDHAQGPDVAGGAVTAIVDCLGRSPPHWDAQAIGPKVPDMRFVRHFKSTRE